MNVNPLLSLYDQCVRAMRARAVASAWSPAGLSMLNAMREQSYDVEINRLCLTTAELRELSGYKAHRAQCRWLAANGLRYFLDRCGRPKVLRALIDARLGVDDPSAQIEDADFSSVEARAVRPNFSALSARYTRAPSGRQA